MPLARSDGRACIINDITLCEMIYFRGKLMKCGLRQCGQLLPRASDHQSTAVDRALGPASRCSRICTGAGTGKTHSLPSASSVHI